MTIGKGFFAFGPGRECDQACSLGGGKAGLIWRPRFRQMEKSLSRVKTIPSGFGSAIRTRQVCASVLTSVNTLVIFQQERRFVFASLWTSDNSVDICQQKSGFLGDLVP